MSPQSKQEYLKSIIHRYKKANRKDKKIILDEFCNICNYHRKYAIKLLNNTLVRVRIKPKKQKRKGRKPIYNKPNIINALEEIWKNSNLPCSKRLKAIIPIWLPGYEQSFSYLSKEDKALILSISPATIDRLLKHIRPKINKKGLCTTKPGTLIKKRIPIQTNHQNFLTITSCSFSRIAINLLNLPAPVLIIKMTMLMLNKKIGLSSAKNLDMTALITLPLFLF